MHYHAERVNECVFNSIDSKKVPSSINL